MSDNFNDENNSQDFSGSIEETRKKKIENFKVNFDEDALAVGQSAVKDDEVSSYRDYDLSNFDDSKKDYDLNQINSYSDEDTKERIAKDSKKYQKQKHKEEKKRIKAKSKRNRRIFRGMWIIAVVIVGVLLSQIILVGVNDMLAITRDTDSETVVKIEVPKNPTLDSIAELLYSKQVIDSVDYFKIYANITGASDGFRQGNFEMRKNMDYEAIINHLQSNINRTDIVKIAFSEGMNLQEIVTKLHSEGVTADTQKFLDLCNSNEFDETFEFLKEITNTNDRYYKLEGFMYPDTYEFYLNEEPSMSIKRFLSNYYKKVIASKTKVEGYKKKVSIQDRAKGSKYSLDQIITLASIIQAESLDKKDMYNVSSVLHNRLESDVNQGVFRLDCDSTSFYPYRNGDAVPKDIRKTFKSTYDTYKLTGLPPGPICNPGMDAIDAALNPNNTDYVYFCHSQPSSGETSKAYYATNLHDHNYNLQLAGLA